MLSHKDRPTDTRTEDKGITLAEQLYECMFLLDSSRYAQDPQGTEATVREYLEKCEAEIVGLAPWQDGKLAYEIDGHRKGMHYLVYFKMDGSKVEALTRMCKLSEVVIRQLLLEHEPKLFALMTQQFEEGTGPAPDDGEEVVAVASKSRGRNDDDDMEDDDDE